MWQLTPGWRGADDRDLATVRGLLEQSGWSAAAHGELPSKAAKGRWVGNPDHGLWYRRAKSLREKWRAGLLPAKARDELEVAFPGWCTTGEDCPPYTASPPPSACRLAPLGVGGMRAVSLTSMPPIAVQVGGRRSGSPSTGQPPPHPSRG